MFANSLYISCFFSQPNQCWRVPCDDPLKWGGNPVCYAFVSLMSLRLNVGYCFSPASDGIMTKACQLASFQPVPLYLDKKSGACLYDICALLQVTGLRLAAARIIGTTMLAATAVRKAETTRSASGSWLLQVALELSQTGMERSVRQRLEMTPGWVGVTVPSLPMRVPAEVGGCREHAPVGPLGAYPMTRKGLSNGGSRGQGTSYIVLWRARERHPPEQRAVTVWYLMGNAKLRAT